MALPATANEKRLRCFFLGTGACLMSPLPLLLTPLFHQVEALQPIRTWTWLEIVWFLGAISLLAGGLSLVGFSIVGKWMATDDVRMRLDSKQLTDAFAWAGEDDPS